MKKLLQLVCAVVISTAFVGGYVSADDGSIQGSGPGSNNQITFFNIDDRRVTCTNNIITNIENNQGASTGNSDSSNNTTGGGATTGSSDNTNTLDLSIGASCAPLAATVDTPETPGGGGGAVTEKAPLALPNTSNAAMATIAAIGVAVLAAFAVASRLTVAAYRHFAVK